MFPTCYIERYFSLISYSYLQALGLSYQQLGMLTAALKVMYTSCELRYMEIKPCVVFCYHYI